MEPLKKLNTRLEIQEGMTVKDVQAKGNAAQKAAAILFDFNGDGEFDYYEAYSFNQSRIAYDANNGEVRLYDKDKPNGTAPVETVNIEEAKAEYSKKSAKYQKFAQTLTHFGIDVSSAEWVGINDCEVKTVNGKTYLILKAVPQTPEPDPNESSYSIESHFELSIPIDKDFDPKNIIMYRAEMGATNPSAVFLPILFATSASTLIGFLSVAYVQKLNIFNKVVLGYLLAFMSIIALSAYFFISNSPDNRTYYSTIISNMLLYGIVVGFIVAGLIKRLNVYEVFIEGAKEGFGVAVKIIPYLVAMLVGIAVFRSSGALDYIIDVLTGILTLLGVNTDFVPALPTALLKPLSGSGARAMMIETMSNYGADSFPSFVSGVIQGSTETTFYILAVYFGAIKVMKTRHALPCALLADFAGISTAIICGYLFY